MFTTSLSALWTFFIFNLMFESVFRIKSVLRSNENSSLEDASQDVKEILQEDSLPKDGIHSAVELSSLEKLFSQKIILTSNHYHAGENHCCTVQNNRAYDINARLLTNLHSTTSFRISKNTIYTSRWVIRVEGRWTVALGNKR